MKEDDAQKLAKSLHDFTISSIEEEKVFGLQKEGKNLALDFQHEVLANIFSFVGSSSFNKPPPQFMDYLAARSPGIYKDRIKLGVHMTTKTERTREEYAVRNLMFLRQVCKKFEYVINNEMSPGIDYDHLMIDVKIKRYEDCPRGVVIYKYGGNGSQYPATRLRRVRRFNETPYEHIQKCEKIRNLYISDMYLSEELFETILRLDLTKAEKITFERIVDLNFDESINVVNYIQNFLKNLKSPAVVYFHSDEFDPNSVLFEVKESEVTMEEMGADNLMERFGMAHEVLSIETIRQRHKDVRKMRRRIRTCPDDFRGFRAVNVVNNILNSQKYDSTKLSFSTPKLRQSHQKKLAKQLDAKTVVLKRCELRKTGQWHLKKVFDGLRHQPVKGRKTLLYHLKALRQIAGEEPLDEEQQLSIIHDFKENSEREQFMKKFPFLEKFALKSRLYPVPREFCH